MHSSSNERLDSPVSITGGPGPRARTTGRQARLFHRRQRTFGLIALAPAVVLVGLFFIVPLVYTFWISLNDWPLQGKPTFAGLDNYAFALIDTDYRDSLLFTLRFATVTTVISVLLSFSLALLVWRNFRGVAIFRSAYFFPVAVGMAAAGYLWFNLFNPQVGAVDQVLLGLGVIREPVNWLANEDTAFWAVVITSVWKSSGFGMVMYLVALQAIPTELRESFSIDGAGRGATLRFLVVPLVRRTTALVLVFSVLNTTLAFDQFYAMTKGGPGKSMVSAVYSIYNNAFVFGDLGYGSTLAVILLVLLTVVSAIQLYLLRSDDK